MVARLEARVGELTEQLAVRDARVAELEALLGEARRGGKRQAAPFSKGDPKSEPARPGRKPGDAHGRHGHRLAPESADRELLAPLPGACPHCGSGEISHERDAEQWQLDLPELPSATVTRFRVAVGRCRSCSRRVQGRHPDQASDALGAAGSQVGPTAKAWAMWLHYGLGLSFAKCAQVLGRLGINVTAGAVCSAAQSTGSDLVSVHEEIVGRLNDAPMVVLDETGWRVGGHRQWLWIATNGDATAYDVAGGRGFDEACRLIDEGYDGTIVRDGWAPYRRYTAARHQTCIAHLLRRCDEMIAENPSWEQSTPHDVKELLGDALAARTLSKRRRAKLASELDQRLDSLAADAATYDPNRRLVAHLIRERAALFTFLTTPDIDATNWRAEQGIRPAVVNRKVWGGNRTWSGAGTQSRIMSVLRTATQQGVDPISYLARLARAPDHAIPLFT